MYLQPATIPMGLPPRNAHPPSPPRPNHLGVVVGGLSSWAKQHHVPEGTALAIGLQRAMRAVEFCCEQRIQHLSLYVFPAELRVPAGPGSDNVMALLMQHLATVVDSLREQRVRFRIAGNTNRLNVPLRRFLMGAEAQLAQNTRLTVTLSIDGARYWDVNTAFQHWQKQHANCRLVLPDADAFRPYALQAQMPDPDLLIRTGGAIPGRQPMLWQTDQTALYYTDAMWPDFGPQALSKALRWYGQKDRSAGIEVVSAH
ncbi:undecaprenyl diphosphate synthase family protein [Hydrogenophaga sp.]|uniref:undecaprenyl diphosphate synthase family protein n=1 Tax=Hydrogenophaga sp. TaxID=1904254 RepID=UPI003F6D046F